MRNDKMMDEIKKIIDESACDEEVWVTVEEMFGDAGINCLIDFKVDMHEEEIENHNVGM